MPKRTSPGLGGQFAGLGLLEEQQARLEALRAAIIAGEQNGPPTPFDLEAF